MDLAPDEPGPLRMTASQDAGLGQMRPVGQPTGRLPFDQAVTTAGSSLFNRPFPVVPRLSGVVLRFCRS